MIIVRTPENELFNYAECEELYNKYKDKLEYNENNREFKDVIRRTHFYSFYIWKTSELIGCIYYYTKNNDRKLYVNAFAERGHHLLNIECFKESLTWFSCDIYAECIEKTAIMCLLKCGFKRVKDNLYVYRRKK